MVQGQMGSKSLLRISGFTLVLVLLCLVLPAQGLQCYECNNDEVDCVSKDKTNPKDINSDYKKECASGAIGCIQFQAVYDFVQGDFFHRSCLYASDKPCFDKDFKENPRVQRHDSKTNFTETLYCLKNSRSEKGLPEIKMPTREIPKEKALSLIYEYATEDLGNDQKTLYESVTRQVKAKQKEPNAMDVSCYSCENEMSEYKFDEFRNEDASSSIKVLPYCTEKDATKSIQCKGAYGCASFWEVREEKERQVSRVWRDCWYPGEMRCLRNPASLQGRSLTKGRDADSCKKKLDASSRQSPDWTAWQGMEKIQTLQEYGAYLKCVKDIRDSKGLPFTWSIKSIQDVKDPDENTFPFAKIRYDFCSPSDNCNKGYTIPVVPAGWKPPKKAPVTTQSTTVKPTVNKTGGDPWEGCGDGGNENENGGMLLRSDAYLVPALLISYCLHYI